MGKFVASCGAEGTDGADQRVFAKGMYAVKPVVDLKENARRKILCDINILSLCLNMSNLQEVPPTSLVVFAPYTALYK